MANIHEGGMWSPLVDSSAATESETNQTMCAEKPTQGSKTLTLRQREVLQLLVKGSTMRQAAVALGLKPRTIAYHKYRIMKQFDLETNTDLIRFAMDEQLVPSIRRKRPEASQPRNDKSRGTGG